MSNFYDKQGNRIPLEKWMNLLQDRAYMRIALDEKDDVRVSTVWLGLDHGMDWVESADPIIFETMVFGGSHNGYTKQYSTLEDAQVGHRQAVRKFLK